MTLTAERLQLAADARAWLEKQPCRFKPDDELLALWEAHFDPNVATWDMGRDTKPRAVAD